MMKRIYLTAIFVLLCIIGNHASAKSLVEQANEAYSSDKFIEALKLYQEAEKKDGVSTELYYNIGNTYYRLGNKGKAILYYERALSLDPSNSDARENLDFVNTKIVDKTVVDEANIIVVFFRNVGNIFTSNGWATLAICLFIALITAIGVYVFSDSVLIRKIGFFGGIVLILLVIVANYYAFASKNRMENHDYAIITTSSVTLSTSPRVPKDKTEEAFILNEGTKVFVIDSVETKNNGRVDRWYDVKADDSHRAWINGSNLEKI